MSFCVFKTTGTIWYCKNILLKVPVRRTITICNIKNYRYDETFQFATSKTTGMTRRFNLQHQKLQV